jgi:hypothetical protein
MLKTLLFLLMASPVFAGGGATGGATEFTQVANNTELVATVENTAETMKSAADSVTKLNQQIKDNITNLTSLPSEYAWIKDIANTASESYRLYSNINRMRNDFAGAQNWLERRVRSYQCTKNQRVDSCIRQISRNVSRKREDRVNSTQYLQSLLESGQDSVNSLTEMVSRGREGGTGNKEQQNIVQEQLGTIGSLINDLKTATIESSTQEQVKEAESFDATTKAKNDEIEIYKRKVNIVNGYRKASGVEPLDTTNDLKYNANVEELNNALTSDLQ